MIIEILSADKHICSLTNKIISYNINLHGLKYLLKRKDVEQIKRLFNQYHKTMNINKSQLKIIRDKLGAHHDLISLIELSKDWENINVKTIIHIHNSVNLLFDKLRILNIYCWTKQEKDENDNVVHAFIQPLYLKQHKYINLYYFFYSALIPA